MDFIVIDVLPINNMKERRIILKVTIPFKIGIPLLLFFLW